METPGPAFQGTQGAAPVWRFLITPRWLGWHVLMVVACWGMLWLGDWQLRRALAGNGLSWAYTFEWPLFAGFAVVFWAKTIRDEFRIRRGGEVREGAEAVSAAQSLPAGLGTAQVQRPADAADDAQVPKYTAYLARLNDEVKGTHGKRYGFR
jgi:DNA-binding transcriptional regulator of glucitol operon